MNDSTSDTIKVDTARLPLLLRELRLPTIAAMWQSFTLSALTAKVGRRHDCWPPSPSWNLPNAISDAFSDIWSRPACHPAKPSTASILPLCRC